MVIENRRVAREVSMKPFEMRSISWQPVSRDLNLTFGITIGEWLVRLNDETVTRDIPNHPAVPVPATLRIGSVAVSPGPPHQWEWAMP